MSGVPLASVLAGPDWAGRHRVLGGRAGNAVVTRVELLGAGEAPPGPPGALLALAVDPVPDAASAWRLDALLRRAADTGAVAVLLPAADELPAATRLLCSRLSICVLGSTGRVLDLVTSAAVALAAPEVVRARAVLAVQTATAQGRVRRPAELVDLLATVLGVEVALLDGGGALLEGTAGLPPPRLAEPVPARTAVSARRGSALTRPVLLPGLRAPQRWLVAAVPPARADAAEVVDACLLVAAAVLTGWLATDRLGLERDARSRAGLLADVLRLGGEPSPELRRRASAAGWPLDGFHVGVRVGAAASVDTASLRDDVVRVLAAAGVEAVVVEHGDGWSGWWTTPREPDAGQVRGLAGSLRSAHRALQGITGCWTGVGRPHAGSAGIAATLAEAADAAALAAGRPEQGRFLHVDQLGVAQTLLAWTRTTTFQPEARSLLAPLDGSGGELVRTLSAYLDAESSLVETAAVLGVHRNTVAARVARIERTLHVDLRDRDQRLALQLACRAVLGGGG